jgi:hypothetical protein
MNGTVNRLDFAIHRCEELISLPSEPAAHQDTRWETWLREDILPAIEGHLHRPSFQRRARWPLETLRPEADTPERQTIEQFQSRLKSLAEVLMDAILSDSPGESSAALAAAPEGPARGSSIGPATSLIDCNTRRRLEEPTLLQFGVHQVQQMASDPVPQLVETNNYFLPRLGLLETLQTQNRPQGAISIVSEPHLLPIGNHVVRRLLHEAQWRSSVLIAVRTQVLREFGDQIPEQSSLSEVLCREWNEFEQVSRRLQQMFHPSEDMALTEGCIACAQLYAAVHPSPNLVWLGLPDHAVASGIAGLRNRLWRCLGPALGRRVVIHLEALKRVSLTANSALEEAIATGGLVINQRTETAFWRGEQISALTPAQFRVLVALGRTALHHRLCGFQDVFDDANVGNSNLSTTLGRLKNQVPEDLREFILPGPRGSSTYRLTLPPEQIHLLSR